MTRGILQVPARKAGARIPGVLAVGDSVIELGSERTPEGGTHTKRLAARWTKGASSGDAIIDLRPTSKTSTEIVVTLSRPKGGQALLWPRPALRRLGQLFAAAFAYEIETRNIEDGSPFDVRRTSAGLVRARAS